MRNKLQELLKSIDSAEFFLLIGFVLITILIRGIGFNIPFERDEGEYAYSAWLVQNGGSIYKDAFLQKPPGIIYIYLISQKMFGDNLWGPRFMAMLFVMATGVLTGLIAAKLIHYKAFYITLIFTPIMLSFPYFMGLSANTETFMITGLMGLIACFVYSKEHEKAKYWIIGAITSVVAILFKPICIYLIFYIYVLWVLRNKAQLVKFIGISLFTGLLFTVILLLPIFSVWRFFWEEVILFNSKYVNALGINLVSMINNLIILFSRWWIVAICTLIYLIKSKARFYFYLFLAALLGTLNTGVGHYYLILMPFLALMTADGLFILSKPFKINLYYLGVITLILLLWPIVEMFTKSPNELVVWFYGTDNPFYESGLVADILKEITDPNDQVFIGGSEPQILYYAQRKNATRFVITYPMTIESRVREDYQKEAVQSLGINQPEVIIISNRHTSGYTYVDPNLPRILHAYIAELLESKYKLVGGYIWKSVEGGDWIESENMTEDEIESASLVMYKKI